MKEYTIPLIIRGRIIEDDLVRFEGRRGEIAFLTPDVNKYLDQIVLRNGADLQDYYSVSLDNILDFLEELGRRLHPDTNPDIRLALEMNMQSSGQSPDILRTAYVSFAANLRRTIVEEAVDQNIGRDYLEGWKPRSLHDRDAMVRAFGSRIVHLNAGNAPNVALHAVINGAVLRCDNIVKSPSNDPFTAVAIAKTMIAMDPDHPITRHMTVAYWKGGDLGFEKKLYDTRNIDKIVAWGGPASMNHIRQHLTSGLDLIALDPKVSASIIGAEALESEEHMGWVAQQLAKDFGYFNQEGCGNSRLAYVVCGSDDSSLDRLNRFGRLVHEALQALPAAYSSPHPAFDPVLRDEIEGIRYSDDYRVFGVKANEGGVIVSQQAEAVEFSDRIGGRVINIIPVPDLDAAVAAVTIHTQTIGIYPNAAQAEIADRCMLRGAQRLSPLGCIAYEGLGYPHDAMEIMRRLARWGVREQFDEAVAEAGAGMMCAA